MMTNSVCSAPTEPITNSKETWNTNSGMMNSNPILANLPEDFELIETIGKGGMGWVVRGHQKSLDREVAIKVIAPSRSGKNCSTESFINEAKMCAKLRHPNIVQIYQVGKTDIGSLFIVMELLGGKSLLQYMENVRIPKMFTSRQWKKHQTNIFPILFGLCDALEAAHHAGIIHRDIKPANIQIDDDGRVRLIDFGIALLKHQDEQADSIPVAGTLSWMAPEQFFSPDKVDYRSDIFSLGGVMLYLLTGNAPRNVKTVEEFVKTSVDGNKSITFPKQLPVGLPKELVTILEQALAVDPDKRYQSVAQFRADLETLYLGSVKPAKPALQIKKYAKIITSIFAIICTVALLSVFHFSTVQSAHFESSAPLDRNLEQIEAYLQQSGISPSNSILLNAWKQDIIHYKNNQETAKAFEVASFSSEYIEWESLKTQTEYLHQLTMNSNSTEASKIIISEHLANIEEALSSSKNSETLALLKAESLIIYEHLLE